MSDSDTDKEEHLKTLYAAFATSAQQFDKLALYIASGAFSLSFTFIKDIINLKTAEEKWLLSFSWGSFLAVIFFALGGHFVSTWMHSLAIRNANLKPDAYANKLKKLNWPIYALNILVILGLLTGCILLILFIHKNL